MEQYSHLSKKVEKERPLIKNKKLFPVLYCYTTNVCHELPESANVLALVYTWMCWCGWANHNINTVANGYAGKETTL